MLAMFHYFSCLFCRFGWFGINPEVPNTVWMNYLGVVLCVMRLAAFRSVIVDRKSVV